MAVMEIRPQPFFGNKNRAFWNLQSAGWAGALILRAIGGISNGLPLGFLVPASLVYFSQGENALIEPVTALWLVTVPLMDVLATVLRRYKHGRKLMEADRSHLHHTLMDIGLGRRQTLAVMVGWGVLCAAAGLGLEAIPAYLSLLCYFCLFLAHCLFVIKSAKHSRKLAPQQQGSQA